MAGKQPKDAFPLLKSAEILQCLNELGIASSEDDLLHPTGLKVQHIYASFNELLLHRKREDMAQPDFEGLQELEFPELHEQSVPMIGFLSAWCAALPRRGWRRRRRTSPARRRRPSPSRAAPRRSPNRHPGRDASPRGHARPHPPSFALSVRRLSLAAERGEVGR